jgi:putative flippase GtrA
MIKKMIWLGLNSAYPIFKRIMTFPVFAYLVVGAANTALNIFLFIIFYWALQNNNSILANFALEIATILSFLITVATGFWLSKHFAFANSNNQKKEVQKQFGKYFLVSLQGQFSDYVITKVLVVLFLINGSVAYIISTVIMLMLNYFLQKNFTFKTHQNKCL